MAWKRSITSSDSSHDTPPHVSISSDSDSSYQSGTSGKYRRIHSNCSRIQNRLPQYPSTPEESFDDDEENRHPTERQWGDPVTDDDEDPEEEEPEAEEPSSEPYLPAVGHLQEPSDDELQLIVNRFEARISHYNGPDGFGAVSSLAAALQHELNIANLRLAAMEASEAVHGAYEVVNAELADRLAGLSVDRVMQGMGAEDSARINAQLKMVIIVLIVLVVALLLRGW